MKIIGERLRGAIARRGYRSISQFASVAEFNRPIISQLCSDKYPFEVTEYLMTRLCSALEVSREYLTGAELVHPQEERTTEGIIFDLLKRIGKIEPIEGNKRAAFRLYGKDKYHYIDMSDRELSSFALFLSKKAGQLCADYVEINELQNSDYIREQLLKRTRGELRS